MKRILGIAASWIIAATFAFFVFFYTAPSICNLVPAGQWKALIDLAIYFALAAMGGITIPLCIGVFGTAFINDLFSSD